MVRESDLPNNNYSEIVLERFESRHRLFVRNYSILVFFGVGFLAFILVPVLALNLDSKNIPREVVQQELELETLQPQHDSLQSENNRLRSNLGELNHKLEQLDREQEKMEKMAVAARNEARKVKTRLEETRKDTTRTKIMLSKLSESIDSENYPSLQGSLKRIYEEKLKDAEALTDKLSKQSAAQVNLKENLEKVEANLTTIESQKKQLAVKAAPVRSQAAKVKLDAEETGKKYKKAQKELERGREALSQLEQRQNEIKNRLSNFQSPFGKLPLSLNEASLAFPFIVSVGFLIYALLLADLLRLRCEYHRIVSTAEASNSRAINHRISLVVPLWIDPLKNLWGNSGGAALIFLPALSYFAVVWLVTTDQFFELEAKRLDFYLIRFYKVLYVIGALFIALGVWRILTEWASYNLMLAQKFPADEVKSE